VSLVEGEQNRPEHLARHPFGALPVLELEDGHHLFESLVILEYLEEILPGPSLFGTSPLERARTRQLERIADLGVLIPIAEIVHATDSPLGLEPKPAVAEHFRPRLDRRLDYLESLLGDGRSFVAGESATVADCTLAAGLQFGRFRKLDFLAERPRLRAWDERYRGRPEVEGILVL
jgi:glutathione S-transferase